MFRLDYEAADHDPSATAAWYSDTKKNKRKKKLEGPLGVDSQTANDDELGKKTNCDSTKRFHRVVLFFLLSLSFSQFRYDRRY